MASESEDTLRPCAFMLPQLNGGTLGRPSMSGVFLSCQAIDRPPARALIDALRAAGVPVECSSRNPLDGEDSRWIDWYSTGLPNALREADVAVLVVDEGWDSSSWMGEEVRLATAMLGREAVLTWNPNHVPVRAAGMLPYVETPLPDAISEAVARLRVFVEK